MPIYEYKCEDCDKVTEHLLKHSHTIPECKDCGRPLERIFPTSSQKPQFRAKGFYETDYKKK